MKWLTKMRRCTAFDRICEIRVPRGRLEDLDKWAYIRCTRHPRLILPIICNTSHCPIRPPPLVGPQLQPSTKKHTIALLHNPEYGFPP